MGDAIVVELLSRFPREVERRLGAELPAECREGLKEIDNVRPLLDVPTWIDGLLRRTCPAEQAKRVKAVWDEMADEFLRLPFLHSRKSFKLEAALKFSRGFSFAHLSRLVSWAKAKFFSKEASFYPYSVQEPSLNSQRARFIVYGHTHHHEIVPLDAVPTPAGVVNQFYINTGTWRRVHEKARRHPREQEFMGYHVMTYAAFFRGDERGGRPFETWSGALGV